MKSASPAPPVASRSTGRRLVPIWVAFAAISLSAVFLLPRLLPTSPSISDSYIFGFNNRVSVLLLLASLAVCGYLGSLSGTRFAPAAPSARLPVTLVRQWMLVYATGWGLMYSLVRGLDGFAESAYLIDRLKRLDAGGRPYRDFEFAYGALFLYGPHALQYLSLSAEAAYFGFWLLALLAGVWMLAQTLNLLDYSSLRKPEIFTLLCVSGLTAVIMTGLNYTFFRFLPASYLALLVQKLYAENSQISTVAAMSVAVLSFVLVLLISPEMGLAFGAGTVAYVGFFELRRGALRDPVRLAAYCGLVLADLGVAWCATRLDIFATLAQFSHGAFSFPILPAPHILVFFFLCGIAAIFAACRLRTRSPGDGPLIVLSVSAGALFAALGRCDPGHVFFAGIGILLVGMLLASNIPRIWKPFRVAFLVFFVAVPAANTVWTYRPALYRAFQLRFSPSKPDDPSTSLALTRAAHADPSSQEFSAPFGFNPNDFGAFHSSRIDTGYYYQLTNVLTPETVVRKIGELASHPGSSLLLPEDFNDMCEIDPDEEQRLIRILFVYPFYEEAIHPDAIWQPLCTYIHQHYESEAPPTPLTYGYGVWKRRAVTRD